jgi:hypothetical protein
MSETEHLSKNTLCDRLMQEGIEGQYEKQALGRTISLTDLAVELGRKDCLACAIAWHEMLERKGFRDERAIILDFSLANAIAGNRYGTKWQWEQETLSREIFYLRRALGHPKFNQAPIAVRCMILNNLGTRLRVAGRIIEALGYWRRALQVQSNFGMALCNRADCLAIYGDSLEDEGKRILFLWAAHKEAQAALAPTAIYTDQSDKRNCEGTKILKEKIESTIDVPGVTSLDPLVWSDNSTTEDERNYRRWCLENCLYLNPSNDIGPISIAATDSSGLASHLVPIDSPDVYTSFFDQMKQEFVSARWTLYDGLSYKVPHFSDRDVILNMTEPQPTLSLAIEKVKTAYRISYSLFDKISFFLNAYMELGIPEKRVSFRGLWREDGKNAIRKEFDQTGNWAFCALFWLAKDFFEKESDEVAEPQAQGLNNTRNFLEHKYLRITSRQSTPKPLDDLALMMSREEFEAKSVHLIKLARSALIYLTIGVGFEEKRRQPNRIGMELKDIPERHPIPDEKKI